MRNSEHYDLAYITIDSLTEGVGSSQITPLISRLSKAGLKINLISCEKTKPNSELIEQFKLIGVDWNPLAFGANGLMGGIGRLYNLSREIPRVNLIHARSDIPAVSGIVSRSAPVLWDVRSLWADQKVMIQKNSLNKTLYHSYRTLERIASRESIGMSTLTSAVVPILEERNTRLPNLRAVVPTTVDLNRFQLSPQPPSKMRALFSGTYNDYYDMHLSSLFMDELRIQVPTETHWARPNESNKEKINVGEEKVILASQPEMALLIPNYSFGISICKIGAGPSLSAAMPTKIGEFLACGRPIVVNKGLGDMDDFIEEFNVGVILDGDPNSLKRSASELIELVLDPQTPIRCRALAEKYFNMDIAATKYLNLYSQMINLTQSNQ
jgi:glycosyltransferase involved in cell wall biosynthesis